METIGAIISHDGSKPEVNARIIFTTALMTQLKLIWKDILKNELRFLHAFSLLFLLHTCVMNSLIRTSKVDPSCIDEIFLISAWYFQ